MSARKSFNRWAVDVMMTSRTGRPFLDLVKVCGALGSNQVETSCVLGVTVEELQEIVDGDRRISIRQADKITAYMHLLWWWHCWRSDRAEAEDVELLRDLAFQARNIWDEVPRALRDDWAAALSILS